MKKLKEQEIAEALSRIAATLEEISGKLSLMLDSGQPREELEEHESMGSCPACESANVKQRGTHPAAIFKCGDCALVWVNNSEEFFKR